jgi:8-oxo-dGTP pyrophosphatase MutT (NUDIX family)
VARDPIPTWYFALVVVRQGDRFLLVHERKHGGGWNLPAGRVERGESLVDGACREALEETGVPVRLTGLLRIEHTLVRTGARVRAIFLAEPQGSVPPKSVPDDESLGAAWVSLEELKTLSLRAPEVAEILKYVSAGASIYPLDLIESEGAPFVR